MPTMPMPASGRWCLLDVDGVLVDSHAIYARAWSRWAVWRGLDPDAVGEVTQGRRRDDALRVLRPGADHRADQRALAVLLAGASKDVRAMPGARRLLAALPDRLWAIVTSSRHATTVAKFAAARLPLPAVRVCADDVTAGKPDPQGYLLAARVLGAEPAYCLVVDDSPAGIAAGRAAGCTAYAIATTHPASGLGEADRCYGSLAEASPAIRAWLRAAPGTGGSG